MPPKKVTNNRYIGFYTKDKYYLYDFLKKKMLSTNKNFMDILEFYIKEQMDSPKLRELFSEKNIIDEFIFTIENNTSLEV